MSGPSPEELASALRATARAAATAALREGLADIDDRYGLQVADEVLGLIDIADVFAGLVDEDQVSGDGVYDPYRLKPGYDQ